MPGSRSSTSVRRRGDRLPARGFQRTATLVKKLSSLLATAAILAGMAAATGAADEPSWDLVIRGARVIDPESGLNAVRDVALRDGRIGAIEASIDVGESPVLNARGQILAECLNPPTPGPMAPTEPPPATWASRRYGPARYRCTSGDVDSARTK